MASHGETPHTPMDDPDTGHLPGAGGDDRADWEPARSGGRVLQPGITLAATPLGNIGDATDRLRAALSEADLIAAEDTRRARQLASALDVEIRGRVVSNFDHNEEQRIAQLLDAARSGHRVLVVTDAGMPVVSDPGLAVVAAAHDAGLPVTCLPGASAVTTALALSGLKVGRFIFDASPRASRAPAGSGCSLWPPSSGHAASSSPRIASPPRWPRPPTSSAATAAWPCAAN